MKKIMKEILASLRENNFNVSDAILGKCSYAEFLDFQKDPDFQEGLIEAQKIRDDFVMRKCMELVEIGDQRAIADYIKILKQSNDANESKQIKKEFMRVLVELADNKTRCLKEYCQVFNASKNQADKQYDAVVAEYNLVTPYERSKQKQKLHENSMSVLFDKGELSETEMYSRLLSKALYDSEHSEYPSERSKARADVISINQRLEEIAERKRKEAEQDESSLIDNFDSLASGMKPSEIETMREGLALETLAIENADS